MSNEPLRLTQDDLFSPKVDAYLEEQEVLRRPIPEFEPRPLLARIFLSSYFYLSVASGLGGFCAWAMLEPFINERRVGDADPVNYLIFPTVVGMVGLFLGVAEGMMCRNPQRAFQCGMIGLGVGFGLGLVALIPTAIIFGLMVNLAISFWKNPQPGQMPGGIALLIFMMGRASAWAVAAIPAGLGQGIALRSRKMALNGLVGAVLGGLIGGLLFDPIDMALKNPGDASVSRAVGFTVIGIMVGLFVSFVEQWTKSAWTMLRTGPLAGKQFILYHATTVLGSSPKADIYLFKDEAIEPRHALIHNRGGRFEIEDCETPDGTYVNGIPIKTHLLQSGDQIVLGKTVLEFVLKDA